MMNARVDTTHTSCTLVVKTGTFIRLFSWVGELYSLFIISVISASLVRHCWYVTVWLSPPPTAASVWWADKIKRNRVNMQLRISEDHYSQTNLTPLYVVVIWCCWVKTFAMGSLVLTVERQKIYPYTCTLCITAQNSPTADTFNDWHFSPFGSFISPYRGLCASTYGPGLESSFCLLTTGPLGHRFTPTCLKSESKPVPHWSQAQP